MAISLYDMSVASYLLTRPSSLKALKARDN